MFVRSTVHNRLASVGFAAFGRDRLRARRRLGGTRARFRLEGLEERCLLSGISGITEFPIPTTSAGDTGIVAGPDGNLWFTENRPTRSG